MKTNAVCSRWSKVVLGAALLLLALLHARPAAAADDLSKKKVLVLGGTGKIGRAVVEDWLQQGSKVTMVGRKPVSSLDPQMRDLLNQYGTAEGGKKPKLTYLTMDLEKLDSSDPNAATHERLVKLFGKHDITIDAAEDYPINTRQAHAAVARASRSYAAAMDAGYTVKGGKVWVRIGSPPAEIARHADVPGDNHQTFEEDLDPRASHEINRNQNHPYFWSKLQTADRAKELSKSSQPAERRFNVRTAAPTYFVGPGSWGPDREPVLKYYGEIDKQAREGVQNPWAPAVDAWANVVDTTWSLWTLGMVRNPAKRVLQTGVYKPFGIGGWHTKADNIVTNSVDAKTVGVGVRLATLYGRPGDVVQLPGAPVGTADLLHAGLRQANVHPDRMPQKVTPTQLEKDYAEVGADWAAAQLNTDVNLVKLAMTLPQVMGAHRSDAKIQKLAAAAAKDNRTGKAWTYRPSADGVYRSQQRQIDGFNAAGALPRR